MPSPGLLSGASRRARPRPNEAHKTPTRNRPVDGQRALTPSGQKTLFRLFYLCGGGGRRGAVFYLSEIIDVTFLIIYLSFYYFSYY